MTKTNPFNLRPSGDKWLGMTGSSNNFLEFQSPQYGIRAGFLNMANQKRLHGIDTIDAYINKYAPPSDNSAASIENYKKMLENALGVTRGDNIDLEDPDTMLKIAKAQIKMEQGSVDYPDTLLQLGLAGALQGTPLEQMNTGTSDMSTAGIFDTPNMGRPLTEAEKALQAEVQAKRDAMLAEGKARLQEKEINQAALSGLIDSDMVTIPDMNNLAPNAALSQVQQNAQQFADANPNAGQNIAPDNGVLNIDPSTVANAGSRDIDSRAYNQSLADQETLRNTTRGNIMANMGKLRPQNDTGIEYQASVGLPSMEASPKTGQTRKQTNLSLPDFRIGRDEMLMRVGGAMMGASPQGGLAAYEAAINQYGNVQDYNRSQGLAAYQAQAEAQAAQAKADSSNKARTQTIGSTIVNDAIGRALPIIEEDIEGGFQMPSTGIGSFLKVIPGSQARSLSNLLDTVKSNIGFDKLQSMREASPTGGALGQVSNQEIAFLQQTFGNLDQANSPEEIKYNLQLLQKVYNDVIHGEGNHQFTGPTSSAPSIPKSDGGYDFSEADNLVGMN